MNISKLSIAALIALAPPSILAASLSGMPQVTVNGTAVLTYPTSTSKPCIADIKKSTNNNNCTPGKCTFPSGTTFTFGLQCTGVTLTFQAGMGVKCGNTQAEFRLGPSGSTYDVSLVNGFNKQVKIEGGATSITANSASVRNVDGIYPYGCSTCVGRISADCGYSQRKKYPCNTKNNCQITNDASKHYTVTFN